MNKTTQLLRIIQMYRLLINPLFLVPLQLNTAGFFAPKKRTAVIACFLIATFAAKIYFLTLYKVESVGFYIEVCHLATVTFLSALSYMGYAVNSSSLAEILNKILNQSKPIADQVFCRKVCLIAFVQLFIVFGIPFSATVLCNADPFFYSDGYFWLFTADIWLSFILAMYLSTTIIVFSNAILLCSRRIAKVNNELAKMGRIDWHDYVEVGSVKKEKVTVEGLGCLDLSKDGLAVIMSMYNSVCQNCADLNASYGCSVSCTYIANLTDMILVAFYTTKYGAGRLWIFIIINFCYFLNIWFVLFACECFTKEMEKTGITVSRLMLETKNEKQKELYQQFSIFLLHRKIKFTAWGLFNLDYKMVYSTLSVAVTYLVLVHQFERDYSS